MNPHITLLDDDPISTTTPFEWKQAAPDVHVATRAGEFAGFVSLEDGEHLVHDAHGRALGAHPTFAAARTALETALVGPTAAKRRASGARRPYTRHRMRRAIA